MPVLGKKTCKAILSVLEGAYEPTQFLINEVRTALKTKPFVKLSRSRAKTKKAETRSEWEQIRAKVLARAATCCEACGLCSALTPLECDHMFGGANRRTLQSVFTVWALCRNCHRSKTDNKPTAASWLGQFIEHCTHLAYGVSEFEDIPRGYLAAIDIARAKLESLEIQGRAE